MFAVHVSRNFGLGDKNVKYELRTLKHQRNEVVMTVGKHTVQVPCKNKRDGKQRAAQAILQVNFVLLPIECICLPIITFFYYNAMLFLLGRLFIHTFQVGGHYYVYMVLTR